MKLAEFVPQVFYDAIARIASGFVLLVTMGVVWYENSSAIRTEFKEMFAMAPAAVSLGVMVIAYVLALVVEGIGNETKELRESIAKWTKRSSRDERGCEVWSEAWDDFSKAYPKYKRMKLCRPADAVAIDVLRILVPGAGSRIVKLRAEVALCGTLAVGWGMLLILLVLHMIAGRVIPGANSKLSLGSCFLGLALLLSVRVIGSRGISIDNRHIRALYNHWLLMVCPGVLPLSVDKGVIGGHLSENVPAFIVGMNAIRRDMQLKEGCGYRKLAVTEIYEDKEVQTDKIVWSAPNGEEICEVLGTTNLEISVFSEIAPQDQHFHKLGTEIYCILQGKMEVVVAGKPFKLQRDDMIVVNPGTTHEVMRTGKFLCRVITANCHGASDKYRVRR